MTDDDLAVLVASVALALSAFTFWRTELRRPRVHVLALQASTHHNQYFDKHGASPDVEVTVSRDILLYAAPAAGAETPLHRRNGRDAATPRA